jgi:cytochrome c
MKTFVLTGILALGLAAPAFAESHGLDLTATGDIAKGEKAFKKCQSCHVVKNDEGETLAGKKAKTGPNLYGIVGRAAGKVDGFRYGKDVIAAGEAGMIFDEATFVEYVKDPKKAIQAATGDPKARSKMSYRVRKDSEAIDLYAFIQSLSPAMEAEDSGS